MIEEKICEVLEEYPNKIILNRIFEWAPPGWSMKRKIKKSGLDKTENSVESVFMRTMFGSGKSESDDKISLFCNLLESQNENISTEVFEEWAEHCTYVSSSKNNDNVSNVSIQDKIVKVVGSNKNECIQVLLELLKKEENRNSEFLFEMMLKMNVDMKYSWVEIDKAGRSNTIQLMHCMPYSILKKYDFINNLGVDEGINFFGINQGRMKLDVLDRKGGNDNELIEMREFFVNWIVEKGDEKDLIKLVWKMGAGVFSERDLLSITRVLIGNEKAKKALIKMSDDGVFVGDDGESFWMHILKFYPLVAVGFDPLKEMSSLVDGGACDIKKLFKNTELDKNGKSWYEYFLVGAVLNKKYSLDIDNILQKKFADLKVSTTLNIKGTKNIRSEFYKLLFNNDFQLNELRRINPCGELVTSYTFNASMQEMKEALLIRQMDVEYKNMKENKAGLAENFVDDNISWIVDKALSEIQGKDVLMNRRVDMFSEVNYNYIAKSISEENFIKCLDKINSFAFKENDLDIINGYMNMEKDLDKDLFLKINKNWRCAILLTQMFKSSNGFNTTNDENKKLEIEVLELISGGADYLKLNDLLINSAKYKELVKPEKILNGYFKQHLEHWNGAVKLEHERISLRNSVKTSINQKGMSL